MTSPGLDNHPVSEQGAITTSAGPMSTSPGRCNSSDQHFSPTETPQGQDRVVSKLLPWLSGYIDRLSCGQGPLSHVHSAAKASLFPFQCLPTVTNNFQHALDKSFSKEYEGFLEGQIRKLYQLRDETASLWQNDILCAKPSLKPFVSRCNSRLLERLLILTEHDDIEIAAVMRDGGALVGAVAGRPSWEPLKIPEDLLDEAEIIRRNTADRERFLSTVKPSPSDNELFEASEKDVNKKCLSGPYHSLDEVFSVLGTDQIAVLRRFGVEQPDKIRPCDDALRGFVNQGAHMMRRLRLSTIDDFASQLLAFHERNVANETIHVPGSSEQDQEVYWRRDHGSAYRQVPIDPESRRFAVIVFCHPITKQHIFYIHNALPFGMKASVLIYNRLSQALTHIARTFFGIPKDNYFDDFWGVGRRRIAALQFQAFQLLNEVIGFDIKTEKDFFGTEGDLLGHAVSLRQFPYIIGPKPERVKTMCVAAQEALSANHLSQAQAGKLAGKNTFSCSALAGKVGRAPNKALYARQHMPLGWSTRLSRNLRFSLKWIRDSLPYAPPRQVASSTRAVRYVTYVDAQSDGDLGACVLEIFHDGSFTGQYTYFSLPSSVKSRCQRYQNPIQIFECCAALLLIWTFPGLKDAVVVFCDNIGQQATLTRGYSLRNDICTPIAHLFWVEATRRGLEPWIARVSSKDNLADGPSRFREAGALAAVQHLNLTFTHPNFLEVELLEVMSEMDSRR